MALLNICMRQKMMTYEGTKKHFGISIPLGKKQNMVLCNYKKRVSKLLSDCVVSSFPSPISPPGQTPGIYPLA